mmetsp:Transcript_43241/g.90862  ORF Transcript_43241/g.90862 Transcript_43241/m.90862 type:complete len:214 (-) Transcript_43241:887-1528(-)
MDGFGIGPRPDLVDAIVASFDGHAGRQRGEGSLLGGRVDLIDLIGVVGIVGRSIAADGVAVAVFGIGGGWDRGDFGFSRAGQGIGGVGSPRGGAAALGVGGGKAKGAQSIVVVGLTSRPGFSKTGTGERVFFFFLGRQGIGGESVGMIGLSVGCLRILTRHGGGCSGSINVNEIVKVIDAKELVDLFLINGRSAGLLVDGGDLFLFHLLGRSR